ncbi:MAG: hypothetical protein LAT82_01275 [Nanoarchaeota archaeon]|nr:hypothetical protein [Nanoarchaeota archaeon]
MNQVLNYYFALNYIKKVGLYFLLISFIILNILDFFNIFSLISSYTGDVDFFKKLLSWALIYYLFASLSITKILTGFKNKWYDVCILIASGLIVFPSILNFYVRNVDFELYYIFSFLINEHFLLFIASYAMWFSNIGIILIILMSAYIFMKQPIHKESFIGSFNINPDGYFSEIFKFSLILGFNYFFIFTFFKFFMEWFALAVDAALIVIGVGYYLYVYIFKHDKKLSVDLFLKDIINTGNDFFKQLILYLQDKKTFFIAIALLISIHLVVDLGVYLIPFATGIDNGLYNVLGGDNDLKPLFGFENSLIQNQYENVFNNESLTSSLIVSVLLLGVESIMYLAYIFLFFILLVMPFYILFLSLQKKIHIPSKKVIMFIITMVLLQIFLLFSNTLNNPIEFSVSTSQDMQGVVFKSQSFFENLEHTTLAQIMLPFLGILLFLLFVMINLFRKFEKYKSFWISSYYLIILVFFLFYSTVFAQSYITTLYYSNVDNTYLEYHLDLDRSSAQYREISDLINTQGVQNLSLRNIRSTELLLESTYFSVSQLENYNFDIVGIKLYVQNDFYTKYSFNSQSVLDPQIEVIIFNYNELIRNKDFDEIFIMLKIDSSSVDKYVNFDLNALEINELNILSLNHDTSLFILIQSIISFIFISVFYVGGLIAYAMYYRRILENLKQKLF